MRVIKTLACLTMLAISLASAAALATATGVAVVAAVLTPAVAYWTYESLSAAFGRPGDGEELS